MTAVDAWIVRATWTNRHPTHYGPFTDTEQAERWIENNLTETAFCVSVEIVNLRSVAT